MSTLAADIRRFARSLAIEQDLMSVKLVDGRVISVPINWFPRLHSATSTQLNDWMLLGDGEGIHWPQLDEDISVHGLLMGYKPTS